jgi:hypothetical protein
MDRTEHDAALVARDFSPAICGDGRSKDLRYDLNSNDLWD